MLTHHIDSTDITYEVTSVINMKRLQQQGITVVPCDPSRIVMHHKNGAQHQFATMGPKQGTYVDNTGATQWLSDVLHVIRHVNGRRETYAYAHQS